MGAEIWKTKNIETDNKIVNFYYFVRDIRFHHTNAKAKL